MLRTVPGAESAVTVAMSRRLCASLRDARLAGFHACSWFLCSHNSELHMVVICHSCILATHLYLSFTIPPPKHNFSLFLGSPSWERKSHCPICLFPLLWTNSTGPMAVSRLINNSGIRGVSWNKIWLLRQQGLGEGRFPLERVGAGTR